MYLACAGCRVLVDAGYRWATWTLERPGIVERKAPVDGRRVLAASEYWSPKEDLEWLEKDVLPRVRTFLETHADHQLRFGDSEQIMGLDELAFLEWLDVSKAPKVGPRYLAEVLRLRLWVDAITWLRAQPRQPWWWGLDEVTDAVRRRFLELS